ncbi:hypothetical protein L195_g055460, partial [Trifolium pratense]
MLFLLPVTTMFLSGRIESLLLPVYCSNEI